MPYSMTGFAYKTESFDGYEISVKVKSLNNRGLDIKLKGSKDIVFFIDLDVRSIVKEYINRGSVDIFIDVKQQVVEFTLDIEKLKEAVKKVKDMERFLGISISDDKLFDIASSLVSEEKEEVLSQELKERVLSVVRDVVKELKKERENEGKKLVKDIKARLKNIEKNLIKIEKIKDKIAEKGKSRILEKLKELLGEEYSERAFIEATLLADKMDITEEIVRLRSHLDRFKELLKSKEAVGRKMDFLCQEMLREINTMGNKMPDLSEYTVEMKTELEKIRQQVQNIE